MQPALPSSRAPSSTATAPSNASSPHHRSSPAAAASQPEPAPEHKPQRQSARVCLSPFGVCCRGTRWFSDLAGVCSAVANWANHQPTRSLLFVQASADETSKVRRSVRTTRRTVAKVKSPERQGARKRAEERTVERGREVQMELAAESESTHTDAAVETKPNTRNASGTTSTSSSRRPSATAPVNVHASPAVRQMLFSRTGAESRSASKRLPIARPSRSAASTPVAVLDKVRLALQGSG